METSFLTVIWPLVDAKMGVVLMKCGRGEKLACSYALALLPFNAFLCLADNEHSNIIQRTGYFQQTLFPSLGRSKESG